jgi:16S rRNA (uracil1498-N3)-methyltransferase
VRQLQRLTIAPEQIQDPISIAQTLPFSDEQQHYLFRVLRLNVGDRFFAILPDRTTWLAQIQESQTFQLLEQQLITSELSLQTTLILSLPKGSGFDDVVRQVTELGVTHIIPVISDRTVLKPSPNRHDRWQRIAVEATEQSERSQTPNVAPPISFSQYLKSLPSSPNPQHYLCWGRGDSKHLLTQLQQDLAIPSDHPITIAIGPEGGWTDQEIQNAINAGFIPVSLGKRILRAITAPAVAMAIVAAAIEG